MKRVGVLSDTHGLLRPAVLDLLPGVDHILHAGDVGRPEILTDLLALAPVSSVWGNVDGHDVRSMTREWVVLDFEQIRVAVIHGHQTVSFDSLPDRFPDAAVVVHGHSHVPRCDRIGSTYLVNPGSAGPAEPGKPVSLAFLVVDGSAVCVQHVDLETKRGFETGC